MKITKIHVSLNSDTTNILAFADILLDDVLEVNHIRIIDGRNGPFVAMPSWRSADGAWTDFVIPHGQQLRHEIQTQVLATYRSEVEQA